MAWSQTCRDSWLSSELEQTKKCAPCVDSAARLQICCCISTGSNGNLWNDAVAMVVQLPE